MDGTFAEISKLLEDGPITGKEILYIKTFELILSLTDKEDFKEYFSEQFVKIMLRYLDKGSPCKREVYKILINLFSNETLSFEFCRNNVIMGEIVNSLLCDIYNNNECAENGCMLLSNITRNENFCMQILNFLRPLNDSLDRLVTVFTTITKDNNGSLDQLSMVFCNLSQLAEVRTLFTENDGSLVQKLVPFLNHENTIRRQGIIGLIRNLSFDISKHDWLLNGDIDILSRLLLPLAGPEQFDDEDNDKLPIDLQYLPDTKTRESNPEIRKLLLETLNKLCTTKSGRQYLRDHNTYVILRELHKWEEHPSVLIACENVVDILIRTEDETLIDNFNTVEIPSDLEEKFNKYMTV